VIAKVLETLAAFILAVISAMGLPGIVRYVRRHIRNHREDALMESA
jgi:hypothetical protein